RLATEDHRDPRSIRFGCLSPRDESDRLPRQDREVARCPRHYSQLEYNSEGRADPCSSLTKDQHTTGPACDTSLFIVPSFVPSARDTERLELRFVMQHFRFRAGHLPSI